MDFDLDPTEKELFDEINILSEGDSASSRRPSKPVPSRQFKKQVSFASSQPSFGGGGEEDTIDMFANSSKMNVPAPPPPVEWDGGEEFDQQQQQHQNFQRSIPTGPSEGYKTIEDEKADLLNRIARLQKKGLNTSARLTVYSDIEDIRSEYKRLTYSIEVDQSIKFQRRMLVACVSGIEFLNKKFDPFDLELDGWSENVMENQEDYDTVFEELFQKYRSKVNVAPEIKLMFMVGGSAMMFHLSKSMFKSFAVKNNLEEQQQKPSAQAAAAAATAASAQRREMRGPGIDLASLGKGLDISSILGSLQQQMPPQPSAASAYAMGGGPGSDDISDIISIGSEVRDLELQTTSMTTKKKRGRSSSNNNSGSSAKKELVL